MKKHLILSLIAICAVHFVVHAQVLQLASDVYPPFTNVEGEKAVALRIVENALAESGFETDYSILPFADVMEGIASGKFHGSAALWKSDEREASMIFSDAYLENRLILVGRKGSQVDQVSLEELAGKSVGIVANYAYGTEQAEAAGVTFEESESDQRNFSQLLSKRVDYILVDELLMAYLFKYQMNDVSNLLSIGNKPMVSKSLHFALRKDMPGAEQIIDDFNTSFRKMAAMGQVNEILGLSAIRADVDGDGEMELILAGDSFGSSKPDNAFALALAAQEERKSGPERIYHQGAVYDDWDAVPQSLKGNVTTVVDPADAGIKIKLNTSK